MERHIIEINEEKCIGCSLCVNACTQDALQLIDGKAKLVNDSYCDGLGMCLPQCPVDAIKITTINNEFDKKQNNIKLAKNSGVSQLKQWPVQLHLVKEDAPFFNNSNLLICADCVPFALNNFHDSLLKDKSLLIACPKLDDTSIYINKLANIFTKNDIKTISVAIMEVPCCLGLEKLVKQALVLSNKNIPMRTITVSRTGDVS